MATYDNLNIARTTLIFDGVNNASIASGTFDLSTLDFLPNVPLIDQIEVERIFDTGTDTKFGAYGFTIADRRQIFVFPKDWYTINEQTKLLTFTDLNAIPTFDDNGLYYPDSRTYIIESGQDLLIPTIQAGSTSGPPVREADKVYIRRKTPSINSIVTFAPGTRLTTTQLNLQFDQLKYIVQELTAKFRNEAILKYDENAVDGPFLGQSDFRMNNNYIKDMNSPTLTQYGTQISSGNLSYFAQSFAVNLQELRNAVVNGTLHRTGIDTTPPTFTGDYTAGGLKLTNLANGVSAQDAATISQISNASNLTTGTLSASVIAANSIPLEKLSTTRVTYTLPSSALETILTAASYGSSTDSNSNNMVYLTTDAKGRISSIGNRSMSYADLPSNSVTANTYGNGKLVTIAVNSKGIITSASNTSIANADLPASGVASGTYGSATGVATGALPRLVVNDKGVVTSAFSRNIEVNDLPATDVTGAGTYGTATAVNANNMLQVAYDTKGRVTSITHRTMGTGDLPSGIPLSKLSGTNDGFTLPSSSIADTSITLAKINFGAGGTIPSGNLPSISLSNISTASPGAFVLPEACVPALVGGVTTTYSGSPIKDFTVDAKGRVTSVTQRAIADGDIPSLSAGKITSGTFVDALIPAPATAPTAATYGSASAIPVITVDNKGRINTITTTTHAVANISDYTTATDTRIDNRAISLAGGAHFTAGGKKILNVQDPTTGTDAATKNYVDTNYTLTSGLNTVIDNRLATNSVFLTGGVLSAGTKKISNVVDPASDQDVVTRKYFTDNSIALSSGVYSVGSKPITDLTMRSGASLTDNDAVNYGYVRGLTLYGQAVTDPQTFTNTWPSAGSAVNGNKPYVLTLSTLAATTGEMLVVTDSQNRTYVPTTSVPAAAGQFFKLDTTSSPKTVTVYLDSTVTPTGSVTIRNFGTSRSVSAATAGAGVLGLVQVPTTGGLLVDTSGNITLNTATSSQLGGFKLGTGLSAGTGGTVNVTYPTATTSSLGQVYAAAGSGIVLSAGALTLDTATSGQLGGIKIGTGLSISSGVTSVKLTDSTSTSDSTTAASATAVKAAYDYAVSGLSSTNSTVSTLSGTVTSVQTTANNALPKAGGTMTGQLALATGTTSLIPLKFTAGSTPTSPTDGSVWYESNALKMQIASGTKTVAFTDSSLTGSAASANKWTAGMNLALGGDLSGNVTFDGSTGVTLTATIAADSVALGTDTTGNYVATVAAGTGITVSGSGSETAAVTVTNNDRGSSQNIFKTITGGSTAVTADSNASSLTISGGSGITVTGDNTAKSITIASSLSLPNSFSTITVAGQTSVVADTSADSLNVVAGSGISISTTDNPESLTFNNTGVLSIAGSSNQITASASTGAVTLTLPQSIGTGSDVVFNKATLGNIIITANTISTATSTGLTLAPATAATSITGSLGVSTTLNVSGASTLTGAVTLGSTLTLDPAAAKINLGSAATTSVERNTTTGTNVAVGDIVLRTPASGHAFFVAGTGTPTEDNTLITKSALTTALGSISGFMPTNGALSTTPQTLGTSSINTFAIQTDSTDRLTVAGSGGVTIKRGLTVDANGIIITSGGLTVGTSGTTTGNSAIYGTLAVNGVISGVATPTSANHAATKGYVDTYNDSVSVASVYAPVRKAYLANAITSYKVWPLDQTTPTVTINTTSMVVGVPEYFPIRQTSGTRSVILNVAANHKIVLLYKYSSSDPVSGLVLTTATVSSLIPDTAATLSEILANRTSSTAVNSGTFTKLSLGTVWDGGTTGTAITLGNGSISATHIHDFVLMRIA